MADKKKQTEPPKQTKKGKLTTSQPAAETPEQRNARERAAARAKIAGVKDLQKELDTAHKAHKKGEEEGKFLH